MSEREIRYAITADNTNFMQRLNELRSGLDNTRRTAEASGQSLDSLFTSMEGKLKSLAAYAAGAFSAGAIVDFGKRVMDVRGEIESLSISFETLLGNKNDAAELFGELRDFAVKTPMQLKDLAQGAQTLLSFNINKDDVMPYLKALGDISMGNKEKFNSLTLAFAQMSATGKLMGQDLMQMIGQGFNPLNVIAKQTGKSLKEVKQDMENGAISAKMVQDAFVAAASEGGQFYQMLEKQSGGLNGALSNLQGAWDDALNSIGESTQGIMMTGIDAATTLAQHWQEVAVAIGGVVASFGAQKAVDAVASMAAGSAATASYEAQVAALSALIPVKEKEAQTDLQQAVASGKMTKARAEHIAALRAEATASVESLQLKAQEARQAAVTAAAKSTAARQELAVAEQLLAAEWAEWHACNARGDAAGMVAAEKNIAIATEMRDTAATAANTAATELNTAVDKSNAASKAASTAATQLDTAATVGDTAATGLLTKAKEACASAAKKLWAALAANPVMLVVAAVVALGYAIYKVATYETDLEKTMRNANEACASQEAGMRKELSTLSDLRDRLAKAKKGTDEWKAAKDAVVTQFGQYFSGLDAEIEKTGSLESSYKALAKSIRMAAAARAMQKYEEASGMDEKQGDELEEIRKKITKDRFSVTDRNGNVRKNYKLNNKDVELIMQQVNDFILTGDRSKLSRQASQVLSQTNKGTLKSGAWSNIYQAMHNNDNYEKGRTEVLQRYGTNKKDLDAYVNGKKDDNKPKDPESRAYWEEEVKNRKAKYESLKKTAKESSQALKDYQEAVKKLDEYNSVEEKTKKSGSKSHGPSAAQLAAKEEDQVGKLADLLRKQAAEKLKIEQDYEFERWQTRIDLMKDGSAKVEAQEKLDAEKEKIALKRRKEDELEAELQRQMAVFNKKEDVKAASDKSYAKQTFTDSDIDQAEMDKIEARYQQLEDDLTKIQQHGLETRLKEQKAAMNEFYIEYGTFAQQRKALEEQWDEKIETAKSPGERMTAMAGKRKAMADFDYQQIIGNEDISLAFGDVTKLSAETIKELIPEMEKLRSKVVATFDTDLIRRYDEAMRNLRQQSGDDGFFSGISEVNAAMRERIAMQKEYADSQATVNLLEEEAGKLMEEYAALTATPTLDTVAVGPDGNPAVDQTIVSEEEKKRADELKVKLAAVYKALADARKESTNLEKSLKKSSSVKFADVKKFTSNLAKAGKNASQLASYFSDDVAEGVAEGVEAMETMVDVVETIATSMKSLTDKTTDTVTKTVDAAGKLVEGSGEAMKATGASVSSSMQAMEKGSAIIAIIGAAIQLASMVMSLVNPDKKHEKNIERLQKQIDALDKSYEDLGDKVERAYSTDASGLIEQQNRLLEQKKALIRQQMAEEEAKKKTDPEKLEEYRDRLDEINKAIRDNREDAKEAIIGSDIKSAINDFASAYVKAWEEGTDAAESSTEVVRQLISSALTEALKMKLKPGVEQFYNELARIMEKGELTEADLLNLDRMKQEIDNRAEELNGLFDKIQDRYKSMEEWREEITDISFDSVRDNFKELLSDMNSTTADFTSNFSEMLRNALIEGIMSSKYDKLLREWYESFAERLEDGQLTDEERDRLKQEYDAIVAQGLADRDLIRDITGGDPYSQEATAGGWASMGQDTAEELNGRFTALCELQVAGNDLAQGSNMLVAQILSTLQGMNMLERTSTDDNTLLLSIKDMMFLSTGYLEDIARHSMNLTEINNGIYELRKLIDQRL